MDIANHRLTADTAIVNVELQNLKYTSWPQSCQRLGNDRVNLCQASSNWNHSVELSLQPRQKNVLHCFAGLPAAAASRRSAPMTNNMWPTNLPVQRTCSACQKNSPLCPTFVPKPARQLVQYCGHCPDAAHLHACMPVRCVQVPFASRTSALDWSSRLWPHDCPHPHVGWPSGVCVPALRRNH